jgi:hypothetical protein
MHATAMADAAAQVLSALTPSRRPSIGAPMASRRARNMANNAAAPPSATIDVESASPACPIPHRLASSKAPAALTAMDATLTSMGVRASSSA